MNPGTEAAVSSYSASFFLSAPCPSTMPPTSLATWVNRIELVEALRGIGKGQGSRRDDVLNCYPADAGDLIGHMSRTKSWKRARIYTVGHSTRTRDELVALLRAFDISVWRTSGPSPDYGTTPSSPAMRFDRLFARGTLATYTSRSSEACAGHVWIHPTLQGSHNQEYLVDGVNQLRNWLMTHPGQDRVAHRAREHAAAIGTLIHQRVRT
jgi:hypothetical protein